MTTSLGAKPDPAEARAQFDKAMSPREFDEIVEAILQGKYSWACVLILRFAGYNPLHYLPYRTYTRLLKENRQDIKEKRKKYEINETGTVNLGRDAVQSQGFTEQSFPERAELERFVEAYPPELITRSS